MEEAVLTPGVLYWHRDATHANQSKQNKHGPNIYKDTKPKMSASLKLTGKGTWRQVFICLSPPGVEKQFCRFGIW